MLHLPRAATASPHFRSVTREFSVDWVFCFVVLSLKWLCLAVFQPLGVKLFCFILLSGLESCKFPDFWT